VAVKGWVEESGAGVEEVIRRVGSAGPAVLIYTDISRDGTLEGPDVERVARGAKIAEVPVICAGGMSSIEDVRALSGVGIEGVIIGRALYTGGIDLREALRVVMEEGRS